jgi:O-succinylbenzoic acid--CoA ligase
MATSAQATIDFFGLKKNSTTALVLPAAFIGGKMMVFRALMAELHMHLIEPKTSLSLPQIAFDFVAMTPMQATLNLSTLKSIHKLLLGGAPIAQTLEHAIINAGTHAWHSYGMTETASHIALRKLGEQQFTALQGISFSVNEHGALAIHAPNWGIDTLQTNDIVALYGSTAFVWLGRKDNVINSGGVKLYPEKIEEKLAAHIHFNLMVAAKTDELLGQKLILLIESAHAFDLDFSFLPKLERPKEVIFLEKFKYTANGKLNRAATFCLVGDL